MKGDNKEEIESAVAKLSEAAQVIHQQAAEAAQAESEAESPDSGQPDSAEDVVDAEFEEVDDDKKN